MEWRIACRGRKVNSNMEEDQHNKELTKAEGEMESVELTIDESKERCEERE